MRVCCVCGARPNFMKIGAVLRAFEPHPELEAILVHTGQHYDERMSKTMFVDLGLPRPDVNLEVGSASHAQQTARIVERFEPVVTGERRPDLVMVVGDVNSTVACSLVATKLGIPVAHVEAGLRSFDRTMPEEINRLVTDAISDLLLVSERSGLDNLRREGVPDANVSFVGNVMIDTLMRHRQRAEESDVLERLALDERGYAVLTLHRPANVDDPVVLGGLLDAFEAVQRRLPIVFPIHPRTRGNLERFGFGPRLGDMPGLKLVEPLGYLDFLKLTASARLLLTDSGGIQEEATILRVPCLTLRPNTERPATVEAGYNRVIGTRPEDVVAASSAALDGEPGDHPPPERWDGRAGERIAERLLELGPDGLAALQAARSGSGAKRP